jgi:hypothetical protein
LLSGESELTKYLFGSMRGQHFFCKHCGVRAFGIGPGMNGINIGCLEGVTEEELSTIPITYVDGMNDRWNDLPGFFGRLISGKMALRREGRADEKESIQRRANGGDLARG